MSDLISRKAAIEEIYKEKYSLTLDDKADVEEIISSLPTAFDLKSVIEQLDKKSKWVAYDNWDRDIGMTHKVVPFGDIIEILKSAANVTNGKNGG